MKMANFCFRCGRREATAPPVLAREEWPRISTDLPPQNWTESGWNFPLLPLGLMKGIFHETLEVQ
jgi:hypothetical protein